jgi:digeranylgeranylglycerophospholipid reductase
MISVIGAGPAGCFYASKVKGSDVRLFEDHKVVGRPVACTGILTDSVSNIVKVPKDLIVSKIKVFKLVAPNGKSICIGLKKSNLVLDRTKFDNYLLEKAVDSGASVHLGEKFIGYKKDGSAYSIKTNKKTYATDMIVGADGPRSAVAKTAGIYGDRKFVFGYQARCRVKGLEPGVSVVYLNRGAFSWIVPEDEQIARVGVVGQLSASLKSDYNRLIGKAKVLEDQSGFIPMYNPRQLLKKPGENIYLLGDAAAQVKATTYGGIIYGLHAGKLLAEDPISYEMNFKRKLGRELWLSFKMREYMNCMTDSQADELIEIFSKKANMDVIASHDRDFPSRIIIRLLMKERKLWKIGFDILRRKNQKV